MDPMAACAHAHAHAHAHARSRAVDIQFNGVGPTELWSSVATRAIHRVEEFVIVLIMLHFAVGMLGILFGL
ncbi:MAG: hypothetical protein IPI08_17205 [Betaproteobacteria bacterium]|nr:hypothetical protein [Betaproteobacteria bacterium]